MARQIVYGDQARRAVLRGVNPLADAVKITLTLSDSLSGGKSEVSDRGAGPR